MPALVISHKMQILQARAKSRLWAIWIVPTCFSGDGDLSLTMHLKIVCYMSARSLASLITWESLDGAFLSPHRGEHEQYLLLSQKMKSSSLNLGKLQVLSHLTWKRQDFPCEKPLCEHSGVSSVRWPLAQCFSVMRAEAWQGAEHPGHLKNALSVVRWGWRLPV